MIRPSASSLRFAWPIVLMGLLSLNLVYSDDTVLVRNNPLNVNGQNFYAADPSVVVAQDGRLFLFPTTDNRDWEKQFGWSCYSTTNLVDWTDHGVIFSNQDSKWGENKAWAPDIIRRDGKYYFYYYFNNGGGGKGGVGVAVADRPEGPFKELTPQKLCRGHDPAVFGDDDGRYWLYLQDTVYELGDDMASFKSGPTNLNLQYRPEKFEAAYVFKRDGLYYFTIARDWNNLIYYTAESPTGPFEFRGEFFKKYGGNNHHSIVNYKGRWILFYHEWVKNDPIHQRQLRAEYLNFNDDGTIQMVEPTDEGVRFEEPSKPVSVDMSQLFDEIGLRYSGNVSWDATTGTLVFIGSGSMPDAREEYFWGVPASVKKIVVESGVTVRGAFRVTYRDSNNPLFIIGQDRKTSVIEGTEERKWTEHSGIAESDKWRYGAINVVEDAVVHVSNLTSRNPRGYNISGYANKSVIHVDGCDLLDTRGGDNDNSDGFLGSAGSSIRNSFISTSDDAIKIYHDITIEDVTIHQHRNGAPLQFGWGEENETATATIKNLTIRGVASDGNYNMAPLTWVQGQRGVRNVRIDGLTIDINGQIYNEANDTWEPIGLMSVKPEQCTLNLTVERANIGNLPIGVNAAKGNVRVDKVDSAKKDDSAEGLGSEIDAHDHAVHVLTDQWMRDPYVYLHSDGFYYMTCTRLGHTTGGVQGIELWRSLDLVTWDPVGVPWSFDDSSWIRTIKPEPSGENQEFWLWAPEVHFINGHWVVVHTTNRGRANLLLSKGDELTGPYREPVGSNFGHRHDPSIFTDDDGSHWLVWACAKIAKLKDDFSGFASEEFSIGPADRKLGHEGCVIRKIGTKYVLFGTAWSMDNLRQGTYNLYYCTADKVTGPYGPRKFAARFCGHGTPFQDKQGRWWTTAFLNGTYEPDLENGQIICGRSDAWTLNPRGMTLVPLDVMIDPEGDVVIATSAVGYSRQGPEEMQQFDFAKAPAPSVEARPVAMAGGGAEEKLALVESHSRAFETLDEKVRDPFIMRGPDDWFYLTGTTAGTHWGDTIGIRLWKSPELVNWVDLGFVWDVNVDGKNAKSWHFDRPAKKGVKNGLAIWAPEIHYLNGTWWIPHSVNIAGHGLLRSISGKPEGPYEAMPAVANQGIDAHLFQEDGVTHYVWGYDNIVRLKDDFSGVAESVQKIAPSGKHPLGYEGILLNKIGDKYLLIASGRYGYERSDTYDLYYCVSKSLQGPYGSRRMAVKNAGHGNLFQDNDGRWWCTAFDHEFVESKNGWTPWIVPIDIVETDDDIVIEVKDSRFRPTAEDQQQVAELNATGIPPHREGKKPWDK